MAQSEAFAPPVAAAAAALERPVRHKLMPPRGRELLAAVSLGVPGARERLEAEQRRERAPKAGRGPADPFHARRRARVPRWAGGGGGGAVAAKDRLGYYKALGLDGREGSCEEAEIAAAFREVAKRCHPDTRPGGEEAGSEEAGERWRRIVEAKEVLLNPRARAEYDQSSAY